jgi:hypothetical protein
VVVVQQGMPTCDPISILRTRPRPLLSGRAELGPPSRARGRLEVCHGSVWSGAARVPRGSVRWC